VRRAGGLAAKQPRVETCLEIKDHVADRGAAARRLAGKAEHSKRQILDGEFGVALCRGNPAFAPRIMGLVDRGHRPSPLLVNPMRRSSLILAALSACARALTD